MVSSTDTKQPKTLKFKVLKSVIDCSISFFYKTLHKSIAISADSAHFS
jgi:hypothetical protein